TTTVAPQALMMLNSDFVMQCATDFAERLLSQTEEDHKRVAQMYRLAYGREATAEECEDQLAFLAKVERSLASSEPDTAARRRLAWAVLCHTVMAANEFVYVE